MRDAGNEIDIETLGDDKPEAGDAAPPLPPIPPDVLRRRTGWILLDMDWAGWSRDDDGNPVQVEIPGPIERLTVRQRAAVNVALRRWEIGIAPSWRLFSRLNEAYRMTLPENRLTDDEMIARLGDLTMELCCHNCGGYLTEDRKRCGGPLGDNADVGCGWAPAA